MTCRFFTTSLVVLVLLSRPVLAVPTPEQDTLQISKLLHPIPDEEWSTIAGPRVSERYEIVRGDTLSDISRRLFGDAKYWPKIWALNNEAITNPHLIRPGNSVAFMPGSGGSLPALSIDDSGNAPSMVADAGPAKETETRSDADSGARAHSSRRSTDWKRLGTQRWETQPLDLTNTIDANGFDLRSKTRRHVTTGMDLPKFAATEELTPLATIQASRSAAEYLSIQDIVFLETDGELQVGDTYAITREATELAHPKSDRKGWSYTVLGRVKVSGVKDGKFVGRILNASGLIERGDLIIPLPPRIPTLQPLPAPRAVTGHLVFDREYSTFFTSQHKEVFIDRGSEDGVEPGMIFRSYQHVDPGTRETITKSNFVNESEMIVVQVSPRFSSAIMLNTRVPIEEGSSVTLLTDVSDLKRRHSVLERDPEKAGHDSELDELNQTDTSGPGLGNEEEKELKQLENFDKNKKKPEAEPTPPAPESEPAPPEAETAPTTDPDLDAPAPAEPEPPAAPPAAEPAPEVAPEVPPEAEKPLDTSGLDEPLQMPSESELKQSTEGAAGSAPAAPSTPPAAEPAPPAPPPATDAELEDLDKALKTD